MSNAMAKDISASPEMIGLLHFYHCPSRTWFLNA
jgi:hypothetical protein